MHLSLSLTALFCITCLCYSQISTVTDNSCTAATTCAGPATHGCQSTTFTVPTDGVYRLTASIDECSGGTSCYPCMAEVYLYKNDSPPVLLECIHNSCGGTCASISTEVELHKYTEYLLYICKIDCSGDDCSSCGSGCTARATVN